MPTRFLPKNEKFFGHFRRAANIVNEIAIAFQDMLESHSDVERKVANIREIEHRADKRLSAVRWGIAGRMLTAWVVTLPVCMAPGWLIYTVLHLPTGLK